MQFNLETKHDKYKPYQHTTTKRFSFLLAVLCTLGLTANAAVGDEFTLSYPSGSNSYDIKYKVTGESPATVKTVEQSDYHTSMPEGMAIVVPQTVTYEGVESRAMSRHTPTRSAFLSATSISHSSDASSRSRSTDRMSPSRSSAKSLCVVRWATERTPLSTQPLTVRSSSLLP